MPGSNPLYYWDTNLFIAWIQDEQRPTGEMDGLREVIERVRRREAMIMTSVITTTEVLQSKLPAGVATLVSGLMKRIQRKSMDTKIADLAHDLRDYYAIRSAQFDGKLLSVPDAIHLATAIFYRADEFHTFDSSNGRKSLGLLPLSGNVAGHGLKICKPTAKNPQLDLGKPAPRGN
jgi:predicted nucleic acid-binding protein